MIQNPKTKGNKRTAVAAADHKNIAKLVTTMIKEQPEHAKAAAAAAATAAAQSHLPLYRKLVAGQVQNSAEDAP